MSRVLLSLMFVLCLVLSGCGRGTPKDSKEAAKVSVKDPSAKAEKPSPPLALAVPEPMPEQIDGKKLSTLSAADLAQSANAAMAARDYKRAASYQYWYVQKTKDDGLYNLACFLAQIGQTDPAFYWLQKAALEEGVDAEHAEVDNDLASLRRDARWNASVRNFLRASNRYFEQTPTHRVELFMPRGVSKETAIPVIVWLHGKGSHPGDFANDGCQPLADDMKAAIVGISGTKGRGPRSFVWSENPALDAERVKKGLDEVRDRVTPKKGSVILMGFSQGAQMGLEIAVRDPEAYAGAIVMSPGADASLNGLTPSPALAKRGFIITIGSKEHPGNMQLAQLDNTWLKSAKAKVTLKTYTGGGHAFPPDFDERLPQWVNFILAASEE